MPACVPLDGTVDGNYDGIALGAGDVDDKYDGKQLDRLWRWTGLITAAKMGVRYCTCYCSYRSYCSYIVLLMVLVRVIDCS